MNILITGGAGFVGSHLVDFLLKKKHNVTVIGHKKGRNLDHVYDKIKFFKIDVKNSNQLESILIKEKPEVIVHLAGNTSHLKSFEDPINDLESNTKSTLIILEAIKNYFPKCKFILGSTFVTVGRPKSLPVNEKSECNPTSIYGVNKLASEHYTKIYSDLFGLDTCIFRITNSYGPREQIVPNKNAINYLINLGFQGKEITIYDQGKFFRDIIFISDVISGIYAIIKKGKPGNLYWISSGKKTWFYQLGRIISKYTKSKINFLNSPAYTKKIDVGNFVVSNKKLKSLGWKVNTNLDDGIKQTLKYFDETQ